MSRKLATVRRIADLKNIPGADRIELAVVDGWNVVVEKGRYQAGQKIAYFETDTLLPADEPLFEDFAKRGTKTMTVAGKDVTGHVLRTIRLRGQISQGLIMSLSDLAICPDTPEGTDITSDAGVYLYEEPVPVTSDIIGPWDSRIAPKTGATRLQNLTEHWDEITALDWTPTVKIDGTSQTIFNDSGRLRIFGHNWELNPETATGLQVAGEQNLLEAIPPGTSVQFELAGPKINANRLKLDKLRVFPFALYTNGTRVPYADWPAKLAGFRVPTLGPEWALDGSIENLIEQVTALRSNITKDRLDEGVVWHLNNEAAPTWLDRGASIKLINNKYLLKNGL